jgi:predicted acylesterase/phospholipase RssA
MKIQKSATSEDLKYKGKCIPAGWAEYHEKSACSALRANRDNGDDKDELASEFPFDGEFVWIKGKKENQYVYGDEKDAEGFYHYQVQYVAGPKDLKWFEEKDKNYLYRIFEEGKLKELEPGVWYLYEVVDGGSTNDIRQWWHKFLADHNYDDPKKETKEIEAVLAQAKKIGTDRNKKSDGESKSIDEKVPLFEVVQYQYPELAQYLIKQKAVCNVVDAGENTLAHLAVRFNMPALLPLLLKKGVDINAQNKKGETVLHVACRTGCRSAFEYLLQHYEVDLKQQLTEEKKTPIQLLIEGGQTDLFNLAVRQRDIIRHDPNLLFQAITAKQLDIVKIILAYYASRRMNDLERTNDQGLQAFHLAAQTGECSMLEAIYDQGLFIDIKDKQGHTPLHWAVKEGHFDAVKWLIAHGAKIQETNDNGQTILSSAQEKCIENYLKTEKLRIQPNACKIQQQSQRIKNLVFQGGSVKGIAYVGLLDVLNRKSQILRYLERMGGASVGSITAALLAVGYPLPELKAIMRDLNIETFLDHEVATVFRAIKDQMTALPDQASAEDGFVARSFRALCRWIAPNVSKGIENIQRLFTPSGLSPGTNQTFGYGPMLSALLLNRDHRQGIFDSLDQVSQSGGIFPGDAARIWMEQLLKKRTGMDYLTFGELHTLKEKHPRDYRDLYVVALNITTGRLDTLSYETSPHVIISDAVRASMSIPILFKPHVLHIKTDTGMRQPKSPKQYYVDGGVADNYPIWLFDRACYLFDRESETEDRPFNPETLGFRLVTRNMKEAYEKRRPAGPPTEIKDGLAVLKQMMYLFLGDHLEAVHRVGRDEERTVYINIHDVGMLDFDISDDQKAVLIRSGEREAYAFLDRYDAVPTIHLDQAFLPKILDYGARFEKIYCPKAKDVYHIHLENLLLDKIKPQEIWKLCRRLAKQDKATGKKQLDYFKRLGLDIDATDQNQCALHIAMQHYDLDGFNVLLDWGEADVHSDVARTLLDTACDLKDHENIRNAFIVYLIERGLYTCAKPDEAYRYGSSYVDREHGNKKSVFKVAMNDFLIHHLEKYFNQIMSPEKFQQLTPLLLQEASKSSAALHHARGFMDKLRELEHAFNRQRNYPCVPLPPSPLLERKPLMLIEGEEGTYAVSSHPSPKRLIFLDRHIGASLAYVGALQVWDNVHRRQYQTGIDQIQTYVGLSGGSLIAVLLGLNYTLSDIKKLLLEMNDTDWLGASHEVLLDQMKKQYQKTADWGSVIHSFFGPEQIRQSWRKQIGFFVHLLQGVKKIGQEDLKQTGIASTNPFRQWMCGIMKNKVGDDTLTFKELSEKTGKKPIIYAFNFCHQTIERFCADITPNVLVLDALCAAIATPLLYKPCRIRRKVQGALIDLEGAYIDISIANYHPANEFNASDTLLFRLTSRAIKREHESLEDPDIPEEKDKKQGIDLLNALYAFCYDYQQLESDQHGHRDQIVYIDISGLIHRHDFTIPKEARYKLLETGESGMRDYFDRQDSAVLSTLLSPRTLKYLCQNSQSWLFWYGHNQLDVRNVSLTHVSPKAVLSMIHNAKTMNTMRFLKEKMKMPLNQRDKEGRTVLHHAIDVADTEAIERLLVLQAEEKEGPQQLTCHCHRNKSVLDLAMSYITSGKSKEQEKRAQILSLLVQNGFYHCKQSELIQAQLAKNEKEHPSPTLKKGRGDFCRYHSITPSGKKDFSLFSSSFSSDESDNETKRRDIACEERKNHSEDEAKHPSSSSSDNTPLFFNQPSVWEKQPSERKKRKKRKKQKGPRCRK